MMEKDKRTTGGGKEMKKKERKEGRRGRKERIPPALCKLTVLVSSSDVISLTAISYN